MTTGHRFEVVIEGIELDPETAQRIRFAVQKSALHELAEVDFHGDVAARIGNGDTQGITIVALSEDQAREVGLRSSDRHEGGR